MKSQQGRSKQGKTGFDARPCALNLVMHISLCEVRGTLDTQQRVNRQQARPLFPNPIGRARSEQCYGFSGETRDGGPLATESRRCALVQPLQLQGKVGPT